MKISKPLRKPGNGPNDSTCLTMPRVARSETLAGKLLVAQKSTSGDAEGPKTNLLIRGLMERLPKPNSFGLWRIAAKWLRTAVSIFDLVYQTEDSEQ